ncbi:MAG: hypothetical protein OEW00_12005 [candidate division Zixibacteria bacterium]|nr:hypothetical protein [candidate division Zixibacteria bacterium]
MALPTYGWEKRILVLSVNLSASSEITPSFDGVNINGGPDLTLPKL